ncbi:hypothetical protein [Georgenia yuyongxinii]
MMRPAAPRAAETTRPEPANAAAPRVAAFFDLDKTVLCTASSVTLARPLLAAGRLTRSDLLRSAAAQLTSWSPRTGGAASGCASSSP